MKGEPLPLPEPMNCDRIAPFYQSLEYACFGRELERRRFAFLQETSNCRTALVCGGGDGRFLARLLRFNPHIEVDFVDLSRRMIDVAERRISAMGERLCRRVRFYVGDIRTFNLQPPSYDLIVTHFFLDCFCENEIDSLVSSLAASARSGCLWLLSEFREGDGLLRKLPTRAVIRTLYAAFRITTGLRVVRLPNYKSRLLAQGILCEREETALAGLLCSSLWRTESRHRRTR